MHAARAVPAGQKAEVAVAALESAPEANQADVASAVVTAVPDSSKVDAISAALRAAPSSVGDELIDRLMPDQARSKVKYRASGSPLARVLPPEAAKVKR
jgi:hypothetical protein